MNLVDEILKSRGYITKEARESFLSPDYLAEKHDPFLLPDMNKAVERLIVAKNNKEKVVIYGDYDIDGLTASTVLLDSFEKFGINASVFIPDRFVEGYGLSKTGLEKIALAGGQLVVTVDCGSISHLEVEYANSIGLDIIVTDHHSVSDTIPEAVAVINPKRLGHDYPFIDLAGVGVAFKLVQALQTRLDGLPDGQEKWLLDLVALGTVCDVVELKGENRANVFWGLRVMQKTRRIGIKMLASISKIEPAKLDARTLGFVFGPRLNASGRLKTAKYALDLLTATDGRVALGLAEELEALNRERRIEQDRIYKEALEQVVGHEKDPVLVVSDASWSHGIIGIVASKLLETYHKPVFVLQELSDDTAKGSARSFGDFSAVDGIRATEHLLIKGGGHKLAAGVTLKVSDIEQWRKEINKYYSTLKLGDQSKFLLAKEDVGLTEFGSFDDSLLVDVSHLEPYGNGNPEPVFLIKNVTVVRRKTMGGDNVHIKYTFVDKNGRYFSAVAWNSASRYDYESGESVNVWVELMLNEWQGRRSIEGRLLRLELA